MALWGKTDDANNAPKFVAAADANNIYFVDETEAQVASNKAKALGTPGWTQYTTYVTENGKTRHRSEVLVALKETAANAGDLGVHDPIAATALVTGVQYVIVTTGTTDFTAVGAADSNPGTVFTATGAGTGTGTARVDEDAVVADS